MSIVDNTNLINELVAAKDAGALEKYLTYCDLRSKILKSYVENNGADDLQDMSKEFKSKALKQQIELICE